MDDEEIPTLYEINDETTTFANCILTAEIMRAIFRGCSPDDPKVREFIAHVEWHSFNIASVAPNNAAILMAAGEVVQMIVGGKRPSDH
ncbi:hypothetical protein ACLBXM_20235 [Xanthobacteraceae bacterium A53D]